MGAEKLRIGIIGIGQYAQAVHVPRLRETGKAEIVAIARRDPEALAIAQRTLNIANAYTDWRALLEHEQLDAVVVSTPHHLHCEPTVAALQSGCHVLVEKPMALTAGDARRMVQAAKQACKVLMVGYNCRCRGIWQTAKQGLSEGAIGKLQQITVAYCTDTRALWDSTYRPAWIQALNLPDNMWRSNPAAMGGGAFADIGSHVVDTVLWLADASPTTIVAFTETAGLPVDSLVNVQARLANGALCAISYSAGVSGGDAAWFGHGQMTIFGDSGVLTAAWRGFSPEQAEIWIERNGVRHQLTAKVPDRAVAAAFIATITENQPNPAPASSGADAVSFTEAMYRSAAEGRIIRSTA